MMLVSQPQQTVLAISSYLINLLFNTGNTYRKKIRLKTYSDTLKKYLYGHLGLYQGGFLVSSHALSNLSALLISASGIQQPLDGP